MNNLEQGSSYNSSNDGTGPTSSYVNSGTGVGRLGCPTAGCTGLDCGEASRGRLGGDNDASSSWATLSNASWAGEAAGACGDLGVDSVREISSHSCEAGV